MTSFEKRLLSALINMHYETENIVLTILQAVRSEDTGHIGDAHKSEIQKILSDYIKQMQLDDATYYSIDTALCGMLSNYTPADEIIEYIEKIIQKQKA